MIVISAIAAGSAAGGAEECYEVGKWVFAEGLQTLDPADGRECSVAVAVISATPVLHSSPSAHLPGEGDFRTAGVTALEAEIMTQRSDPGGCGLPLTLVLRSHGDTMTDRADDDFVYLWDDYEGLLIAPCAGEGWLRFRFEIPSGETSSLPDGWTGGHPADPVAFREGVDWNDVITDVDRIELWWGVPSLENPPRDWIVAIDEIEFWLDFDSPSPDRSAIVDRLTDGSMEPPLDQGPVVESSPLDDIHDRP